MVNWRQKDGSQSYPRVDAVAVTFTTRSDKGVLLTMEQVEAWRAERADFASRLADLDRKLEAAAVFFPEPAAKQERVLVATSLNDAIRYVLGRSQTAMSPKDIREALIGGGFGELMGSENYLYTAIKRLADRGLIAKTAHGYVSESSSEEEAGGHSAPGPRQLTLSGGAGGTVPEVGGT